MLKSGSNDLHLVLDPDWCNGCGSLFWRAWDVSVEGWVRSAPNACERVRISDFHERFNTISSTGGYSPVEKCPAYPSGTEEIHNVDYRGTTCLTLPDDELNGRVARRLVSAPNEPYLIHSLLSGVIAPFYSTYTYTDPADQEITCSYCPSTGWYRPFAFDPNVYATLVAAARRQVAPAKLMALHLGAENTSDGVTRLLDLDILEQQTQLAAGGTDYTGLWQAPVGVRFLNEKLGAFADCSTSGSSLYAHYPGRQVYLSGWYQRWVSTDAFNKLLDGRTITVVITPDPQPTSSGVGWRITAGSVTDEEGDLSTISVSKTISLTVGSDRIYLGLELTDTWHLAAGAYFQLTFWR